MIIIALLLRLVTASRYTLLARRYTREASPSWRTGARLAASVSREFTTALRNALARLRLRIGGQVGGGEASTGGRERMRRPWLHRALQECKQPHNGRATAATGRRVPAAQPNPALPVPHALDVIAVDALNQHIAAAVDEIERPQRLVAVGQRRHGGLRPANAHRRSAAAAACAAQAPARRAAPGRGGATGRCRLAAAGCRAEGRAAWRAGRCSGGWSSFAGGWGPLARLPVRSVVPSARSLLPGGMASALCHSQSLPPGSPLPMAPTPGPQTQPWRLCRHPDDLICATPKPASAPDRHPAPGLAAAHSGRAAGPRQRRGRHPIQRWRGPWALLRAAWARSSTAWAPPWALATGRPVSVSCMPPERRWLRLHASSPAGQADATATRVPSAAAAGSHPSPALQ